MNLAIEFLAPERLLLLALVGGLAVAYVALQRRRSRFALRFSSIELFDGVAPNRPGWRRHVPALALVVGLALLVVGAARPARAEEVPTELAAVIIALDTSRSMEATDVAPSRLAAAQEAARRFLEIVPPTVRVGLVSFSQTARVVARPTTDHAAVARAIDRLRLGAGTAIGEAIYSALDELQVDALGPERVPGSILLLSDGETTVGRPESEAAAAAAAAGVPISTIAFGTRDGTVTIDGQTVPVPPNPEALGLVAEATGGGTYDAATADQLRAVFETLGSQVGTTVERHEIGDQFSGVALGFLLAAAVASLAWFSRLP